jgi:hypothetical protein
VITELDAWVGLGSSMVGVSLGDPVGDPVGVTLWLGEPVGDGVGLGVRLGLGDGDGDGDGVFVPGRGRAGSATGATGCPGATTRTVNDTNRRSVRPSQVSVVTHSRAVYVPGLRQACQTVVEPLPAGVAAPARQAAAAGAGYELMVPSPQS